MPGGSSTHASSRRASVSSSSVSEASQGSAAELADAEEADAAEEEDQAMSEEAVSTGAVAKRSWDLQLIRRALHWLRPFSGHYAAMFLFTVLSTLTSNLMPRLRARLIDDVLANKDYAMLPQTVLAMVLFPLLHDVFVLMRRYVKVRVTVFPSLRQDVYAKCQRLSMAFYTRTKLGELAAVFGNDVNDAATGLQDTLESVMKCSIRLVIVVVNMLLLEWRLALLAVVLLPLHVMVIRRIRETIKLLQSERSKTHSRLTSTWSSVLNADGLMLAKVYNRLGFERERFRDAAMACHRMYHGVAIQRGWLSAASVVSSQAAIGMVFWWGGLMVMDGRLTSGQLLAFASFVHQVRDPLNALSLVPAELIRAQVGFSRLFAILDLPDGTPDRSDALALPRVLGYLEFRNVWFRYPGRQAFSLPGRATSGGGSAAESDTDQDTGYALQDVSFSLQPGQTLAIVGPSGSGKTTISRLLLRLFDVSRGAVLVDGHDVRDVKLDSLMQHVGVVAQDTFLFNDTLAANLRYAQPDASQEQLEAACKAVELHDFILSLPHGYDTVVGDRGQTLSGGQRQRISIARVLLKDPPIVVLDEATAHLDTAVEESIHAALQPLLRRRASVIIAHRLSTVTAADVIVVVRDGRVVETGAPAELLQRQDSQFAEMYQQQTKLRQSPGGASSTPPLALAAG